MDNKLIENVEFVIFDTETTGLFPESGDRIVEIAAMRFKGEKKIAEFSTLVNPMRPVSPGAFAVNKISDRMLENAPPAREVLPEFLEFIKGSCLCSYNLPFDLGFVNNELKLCGLDPLGRMAMIDILAMARALLPKIERHALWFVAREFGIKDPQQHRAFSDVEMTRDVFFRFKIMLAQKGISGLDGLLSLFCMDENISRDIIRQKTAKIEEAIERGLKLRIKYFSRSGADVSERDVAPAEIRGEGGRDYLVGFCFLKNEERTFRIDNIVSLEII